MTGLQAYSIILTTNYKTWLDKILKNHYKKKRQEKHAFQQFLSQLIKDLSIDPRSPQALFEALPSKVELPESLEFRKLRFKMPGLQGTAACGRLMYLIDSAQQTIILVWIYTHAEFEGRPSSDRLSTELRDAIDD